MYLLSYCTRITASGGITSSGGLNNTSGGVTGSTYGVRQAMSHRRLQARHLRQRRMQQQGLSGATAWPAAAAQQAEGVQSTRTVPAEGYPCSSMGHQCITAGGRTSPCFHHGSVNEEDECLFIFFFFLKATFHFLSCESFFPC
ncbi:hypothetical protein BRADI_1g10023v3 [Brachypodium distachyon]|uniref:Uncharacterized protein n=1 Tax=Brachypodium distachyon TaxID=15368 RepID=A0A0Q3KQR0_BRADI|nr:hypothetical protein BRADI_1g10023v3 [Brachypodium distachyon]KQK13417.1 hypothetical protein BRADI_1g10023v3 [Brachypodium distachyon]